MFDAATGNHKQGRIHMIQNADLIHTLNILIETCKDGEKGYHEAAEAIQTPQYETYFNEYARMRHGYATSLQNMVRSLGGDPDRKGTITGTIHRGWMHIRSSLHTDNATIITQCLKGEEAALKNYDAALKQDLPPKIRTMVEEQYREILRTSRRVGVMKSS